MKRRMRVSSTYHIQECLLRTLLTLPSPPPPAPRGGGPMPGTCRKFILSPQSHQYYIQSNTLFSSSSVVAPGVYVSTLITSPDSHDHSCHTHTTCKPRQQSGWGMPAVKINSPLISQLLPWGWTHEARRVPVSGEKNSFPLMRSIWINPH